MPAAMAIGLVIFGLIFFMAFWGDFRAARRGRFYLKTTGVVKRVWVDNVLRMNNRNGYVPMLEYAYQVSGRRFVGNLITRPARSMWSQEEAEASVASYASAGTVEVWYDPKDPRVSCIQKTSSSVASLPLLFAAVLMLSGIWGLIAG